MSDKISPGTKNDISDIDTDHFFWRSDFIKTINMLAIDCYRIAKSKGFYENGEPNFGERIALMHSELSEALEAYRETTDIYALEPKYSIKRRESNGVEWLEETKSFKQADGTVNKPEGVPSELADVIIRILDFCGANSVDIGRAIREKIEYNKTRPYKHNKKF